MILPLCLDDTCASQQLIRCIVSPSRTAGEYEDQHNAHSRYATDAAGPIVPKNAFRKSANALTNALVELNCPVSSC